MVSDREARWPAVAYEALDWVSQDAVPMSRSARRRHTGPYNAAVVPRIAGLDVSLPTSLAAQAEDATAAIARFDTEMGAELSSFASIMLRSESAASSKIENLTASARAVAEAELNPHRSGNAQLIVANTRAMDTAIACSDHIDADAILAMHDALLGTSRPQITGRWRGEQVWIGGSDFGPHGALFVPPDPRHVPAAIEDLVAFIDRDDIPVIAHAALAHAQFETIHPFPDGNGRTGRALLHAQLRSKGATRNVTVPVSAGLLAHTDAYFDALSAYRDGDHLAIIERLVAASFAAVANGTALVHDLRTVRLGWQDQIKARRDSNAWNVADLVMRHPVINSTLVARELSIAKENTYRAIRPLVDAGVLVEFSDKKRNQMWQAPDVLRSLDAFATRAGRRRPATPT